ncbi:(deoxy)nucleoside triphosphate pyrophosphohydrolase [Isosphaeraceae bacterium EP7]
MSSTPAETPLDVGIALVHRDGSYLIRRRPVGSPMPGYWEFPGGKCEPGEPPEAATARECLEETGLIVSVDRCRRVVVHRYPHGFVRLHYYQCTPEPGAEPALGSGFLWAATRDLTTHRFPEANEPILADLAAEASAN